MNDRKLRAIGALSLISGTILVVLSLIFYLSDLPAQISIPILIIYTVIQFRLSGGLFRLIYQSRYIDLPSFLQKRHPPQGYDPLFSDCDILLLRTPSAVLSAPDCGEALGLGYLASILRQKGYNAKMVDARLLGLDVMQTVELVQVYRPKALGINLNFQYLAPSVADLIRSLRIRGFSGHITLGGLYASMAYEELFETMPGIDTVVRFEGEHTYLEFIRNIDRPEAWSQIQGLVYMDQNGELIINPLRPLIPNLNTIPDPARDFLPASLALGGYAYVVSSRGCNGVCTYCVQQRASSEPSGLRWRGRDAVEVASEVQRLRDEFGIKKFSFVDDDFFGLSIDGKTHAQRVAEALIERNLDISILLSVQPRDVEAKLFSLLKRAGVDSLILAVDNFSQSVLDRYKKLTSVEQNLQSIEIVRSLEMDAYLGIIMFDPWTTLDELTDNLIILRDIPYLRPWQILSKLEFYKGSPITDQADQQGLLTWNGYSARYDFLDPRVESVYGGIETLMKILHPSMSDLDALRWGNLMYSEMDEWVLSHFTDRLAEINSSFTRQALDLSLQIVTQQQGSSEMIHAEDLASVDLQGQAERLNRSIKWEINILRKDALEHKKVQIPAFTQVEELEV